jgi:hypothetical protein
MLVVVVAPAVISAASTVRTSVASLRRLPTSLEFADKRIHGWTKRQVAAISAGGRLHPRALPLEPALYYQYGELTVHLDGCVGVKAAY